MASTSARERLLEAAAELVANGQEVSTRAVCEAAGVAAPTLYHHFGDRDGLVEAAIARAFESRLQRKRARRPTGDPVEDIRRGWREHVRFAREHPGFYRLMYAYADARPEPPAPAREARAILMGEVRRAAAAGRLRVEPELAAEVIHTAVRGVGAMVAANPDAAHIDAVDELIRNGVLAALFTEAAELRAGGAAAAHAVALGELLTGRAADLSEAEAALLREWLARIASGERKEDRR